MAITPEFPVVHPVTGIGNIHTTCLAYGEVTESRTVQTVSTKSPLSLEIKIMKYRITVGRNLYEVEAKTPGAAARIVFKGEIKAGRLKNQPPSTYDGGWVGVTIIPIV